MTRHRLTPDQTIELDCALADRDLAPTAERVSKRAFRSTRVSLSDDELAAVQTEVEHVDGLDWLFDIR